MILTALAGEAAHGVGDLADLEAFETGLVAVAAHLIPGQHGRAYGSGYVEVRRHGP